MVVANVPDSGADNWVLSRVCNPDYGDNRVQVEDADDAKRSIVSVNDCIVVPDDAVCQNYRKGTRWVFS